MDYEQFLSQKRKATAEVGFEPRGGFQGLFDWQGAVTTWACQHGRAALFEDCGLGKTAQQLHWAKQVHQHTGKPVLILAPLAVSQQTVREGEKFGIPVSMAEQNTDIKNGINITNYEKLERFNTAQFAGVVLDESSILKAYTGQTKRMICDKFADTPYKLACTATPAPNDLMELLNHAEFLGIMKSSEALSCWFIADQRQSGTYRLKGHAEADFWRWVASWAVCIGSPSDIGYSDEGYLLPELTQTDEVLSVAAQISDVAAAIDMSATGFHREKKKTLAARTKRCAELARERYGQCVIWCYQNDEANALSALLPEAVEIRGSDSAEKKERAALEFIDGTRRILISKPSIFGYGLNFQNCHNVIFCGLDYSFESYYQAVRRFYRFGQTKPVHVMRVMGDTEKHILDVLSRKEKQKSDMGRSMAAAMRALQTDALGGSRAFTLDLTRQSLAVPAWIRSEAM